jgi:hypothetical protein
MAATGTLRTIIRTLEAEQARRRKARYGGHDDPRKWLLYTLQQMAQKFAATAHLYPLSIGDMAPMEMLACRHFLPEHLMPAGLPTADQIWAAYEARK